jgi:catecholate siderophore receptor
MNKPHRRKTRWIQIGALGTFIAVTAAGDRLVFPAHAQQSTAATAPELHQTVEVTTTAPSVLLSSPKYTEPLQDIPQTITVIPESVIHQQGATTLRDVLRNVTGISIQAGEGGVPSGDNLSIRGFNARTDMFVDGIRDTGAYSRDPFNIEQVEVSKGPSSSYVGRGSTGGSINLASKTPSATRRRSVSIAAGAPSYQRGTFDVNERITAIKGSAFRLNGMFTNANTPGRNAVETKRWGLAPSLAFGLNSATSVVLSYNHMDTDNVPDYGIPWVPGTNIPLATWSNAAPPVSFNNFYGLRSRDFEKTFTKMGTVSVRHDFSSRLVLQSSLRYGQTKRDSVIASPRFASTTGTEVNRQLQSRDQTDGIATTQTYLTAVADTGTLHHTLVSGLEVSRETSKNFARSGPAAPTTDLFNPDPYQPYEGPIVRTGASTRALAHTTAIYAGDTMRIAERWELTGSLRWDHFKLNYKNSPVNGPTAPFDSTDRVLSGRAGVVFKPRDIGSIYFGYGTSVNPSAEGLSLTASTADLKPEQSRSFEAGTKWDLGTSRLSVNTAVFRTEKTNARTPGINPGDPPTVLDGKENVDGVELGLSGNITGRLQAMGSYTFMRSRIVRSNESVVVGREFANTPRHSFNIWGNYRLPRGFDLGGALTYTGARFNNISDSRRLAAGYWVADAIAAYRVNEQLTLRLNVSNLTNSRYIDRVGSGHFVPGPGRMAMLTADFGF